MPVQAGNKHHHKHNRPNSNAKNNNNSSNATSCKMNSSATDSNVKLNKNLTRCPHVVLIGEIYLEDLDKTNLLNKKRDMLLMNKLKLKNESLNGDEQIDEHEQEYDVSNKQLVKYENDSNIDIDVNIDYDHLKCDECEKSKNLWLCLREGCMFIGCGQDNNSNKHGNLHSLKTYHPLSINLITKFVWCDLCKEKINLEFNNPPYIFKSRAKLKQIEVTNSDNIKCIDISINNSNMNIGLLDPFDQTINSSLNATNLIVDDYELINYLDQDTNLSASLNDTNDYEKNGDLIKNGQLGLDNLGNTCYMNAALQALSNCYAFTSYFLELSKNIQNNLVLTHQFNQHKELNQSMSFNYMKLMKELWQDPNKMDKKLNYSSVTPSELVHTIKLNNPMFRGYMQHDSQEFLIYLMDQLHEELKRPVLVSSGDENKTVELNKNANNNNGSKTDDEEEDDDKNNEYDETSECENEANTENDEENEEEDDGEDDDDDLTVVQQKQNIISSSNNIDIDSGVSTMSNNSNMNTNTHNSNNSGDESIDSFETCGDDDDIIKRNDSLATSSDLSDKLHFSDADESMPSTFMNNMKPKFLVNENNNKTNKKRTSKRNGKIKPKLNANSKAQEQTQSQRPVYTSIVSECFDGKLISQVQCLECNHISTTTETFQHLSLPIPSKEYLQALHNKIVSRHNQLSSSPSKSGVDTSVQYQGWLSWMMDFMKGYIWTPTIKLTECLTAFFSEDDLKGDNMYSCEKCKKLTNGVKYSKILNLPETLIIHLKRFRHDSMFSTGKINSYVSFPLDNLNMQPFVYKDCKNEITQYDLCSLICHYGSANGGHYTSYARNCFNEEWYEYDDSYCRQVESLNVQNVQAYVLFYKKKNIKSDTIKEQLRTMFVDKSSINNETSLLRPFYISKQWLHKLKYFGEPGPIDNSDFLCKHSLVQPNLWKYVDDLAVPCTTDVWNYLIDNFQLKYANDDNLNDSQLSLTDNHDENNYRNSCNFLFPCKKCQIDDELLKQRQLYEKNEFLRLKDKWSLLQFQNAQATLANIASGCANTQVIQQPIRIFAISSNWFKEWEKFVQLPACPLQHQIPGKINNLSICIQPKQTQSQSQKSKNKHSNKQITYQLNKNSNYYKISEEIWNFLYSIYSGGPALPLNTINTNNQQTGANNTNKNRTNSLSKSITSTNLNNKDVSRQMSATSTSSANLSPPKLNSSISDSNLSQSAKKANCATSNNSINGLILQVPHQLNLDNNSNT